jgi:cellulose synthase/poly-beta-1,6-N-acetylglucosamine synthase-like glycosyltransferase
MIDRGRVSIVVNNYNYGRFLPAAIDSALAQTYPNTEVIAVDDGSTDDSAAIIAGYGPRVAAVMKANGGQTSALNAGFARSTGEFIHFLDADDILLPTAVARALERFRDPEVLHVQWHLLEIDAEARPTGNKNPARPFPEGNLREAVIARGPEALVLSPTSGNAWRRSFLEKSFPLPTIEERWRTGAAAADARLSILAPLYGRVERIAEPLGYYRTHGSNDYAAMSFARKLAFDLLLFDEMCEILAAHCRKLGIAFDSDASKQGAWAYQLKRIIMEMRSVIPEGRTVILVDDDTLGIDRSIGLELVPFLEQAGQYIGPPPDDDTAIREMERLRQQGAEYLTVAWAAFWWLDHYPRFSRRLHEQHRCVLRNERLVIFDLRSVASGDSKR